VLVLRHPKAARGLLLFRVTGGAFAAQRLPENYYGQFIRAAETGGMAAVCAIEQHQERFAANPAKREQLMKMDPKRYIDVMSCWRDNFVTGAGLPVMGVSEDQLRSIKVRPWSSQATTRRIPPRAAAPPRASFPAPSCTRCRSPIRTSSSFPSRSGRRMKKRSRACLLL